MLVHSLGLLPWLCFVACARVILLPQDRLNQPLLGYSSILLGLWLLPGGEGEPELAVGILCLRV